MEKYANVTAIFKAGSETNIDNYWPISVLPVVVKVFERLVYAQLYSFFFYGRVCGDYATVLLLQGSPISYLRRSNSDAAFTLKDFVLYVLCMSAVLFSVRCDFLYASYQAIAEKQDFEL